MELTAGLKIPDQAKSRIKNDVGDYLVEQLIKSAGSATSPVAGESWKASLNKEYAKKKKAEGLGTKANMDFEGDMLDALTFEEIKDGIELGWFGDEAGKADGHNNLSGDSTLPQRRLLPDVGQEFKPDIQKGIEQIVADAIADSIEFEAKDFEDVKSKASLYEALDEFFPDLTRGELRNVVLRTPDLVRLLDEQGLLDYL